MVLRRLSEQGHGGEAMAVNDGEKEWRATVTGGGNVTNRKRDPDGRRRTEARVADGVEGNKRHSCNTHACRPRWTSAAEQGGQLVPPRVHVC